MDGDTNQRVGDGESALLRLFARERRKLETALALRQAAERRRGSRGGMPDSFPDPAQSTYEGLVPAEEAPLMEWIAERLQFLNLAERSLQGASVRELSFFWLGAACQFLDAAPYDSGGLQGLAERMRVAAEHYAEVARATGGEDDESRRREEPWDASSGTVPRRQLRGVHILAEAEELLAEQREAIERLEGERLEGEIGTR